MPKPDLQWIHNARDTSWNKKLKRIAQDWSQFNMPESTVLDVLSSTRNTQATITYQESDSRSTRVFPRLTSYSGYHVATARRGSLPMELHSLMNYQNVTQNLFCVTHFFRISWSNLSRRPPTSPFRSKSSRDHPPHPRHRDRPPPSPPRVPSNV